MSFREKCHEDGDCALSSTQCCVDLSDLPRLEKTCCSSPRPVVWPDNVHNLTAAQLAHLDTAIASLSPVFLDLVVCEGLEYEMMSGLASCAAYLTTTSRTQQLPQTDLAPVLSSSPLPWLAVLVSVTFGTSALL